MADVGQDTISGSVDVSAMKKIAKLKDVKDKKFKNHPYKSKITKIGTRQDTWRWNHPEAGDAADKAEAAVSDMGILGELKKSDNAGE